MAKASLIPTDQRTEATPTTYNNLVIDSHRMLAIAGSELTVASGAVAATPEGNSGEQHYAVDTESNASTDDLDTITGGHNGDVISLYLSDAARVVKLKHNTGNIQLPGGSDFDLMADMAIMLRFDGTNWYMIGGAGASKTDPDTSGFLALTTSYQTLVSAPSGGVREVMQIALVNGDASVTTSFYFKIVRSSTDYVIVEIQLAPGESLIIDPSIILSTTDSIRAKVAATCSGARATASYKNSSGAMAVLNFTGASFADILTVASGKKYCIKSILVTNSYTTSGTVSVQAIDGSSNVLMLKKKTLAPLSCWFLGTEIILPAGYKMQVAHGAASKTGSVLVNYKEV